MKRFGWLIRSLVISSVLLFCVLPVVVAVNIDVEMRLNGAGFASFDHFKAEFYMNNSGEMAFGATIFGILEVLGEYFFWPSFTGDLDYEIHDINQGESHVVFLEFDFENIDEFLPFGPMVFWGAWFLDMERWNCDFQVFWLGNASHSAGDLFATDPIVGNMRFVPAGTFTQGSPYTEPCREDEEGPQFTHILTRNIAVMETEVSRQMWADLKAVLETTPDDCSEVIYSPGPNYPVQQNTWYESVLFANLLSLQNGLTRCYYTNAAFTIPVTSFNYATGPFYCNFDADGYRLPTEGEWEYFTRAGTTGPFSFMEPKYTSSNCIGWYCTPGTHPILEKHCVYCANYFGRTGVVGSKLPNPWNLKDVHGNVGEWCWDWFADYPIGTVINYVGPDSGFGRVYRGSYWFSYARECRSARRPRCYPDRADYRKGLRLVRTVPDIPTPTPTPVPTNTPANTPFPNPGALFSVDPIVGNMRCVPAGTFTQGSPATEPCKMPIETQFTHILTRNIAVMETEISRQMWADLQGYQATLPNDPSSASGCPTMSHPVQRNTWYESVLFANLLSLQNGFTRCYYTDAAYTIPVTASNYTTELIYCNFNADGYRLPTEGEWEYFTRAGTTGPFSCNEPNFGSAGCFSCAPGVHTTLEQYCLFCANYVGVIEVVGSKLPNPWNLKDVHGSLMEWCWDQFEDYPLGTVVDYSGPDFGYFRVFRGGSWNCSASRCRSAYRAGYSQGYWGFSLGFRLVRTVL